MSSSRAISASTPSRRCPSVGVRGAPNCRPRVRVIASSPHAGSDGTAYNAQSAISTNAAASALLAKVTALLSTGLAPGVLLAALHPSAAVHKSAEKIHQAWSASHTAVAEKVDLVRNPTLSANCHVSALPADWLVVKSAAQWFEQSRQATASGAILATVFVSDKAARAHFPLLERLRRSYGIGPKASVRFVYVHIGDGYNERFRTSCAGSAGMRGAQDLTLSRMSQVAAAHGLDVALSSLLPDGIRAFPSLVLTAGLPTGDSPSTRWAAATRVAEATQLVSDWAFLHRNTGEESATVNGRKAAQVTVPKSSAQEVKKPPVGKRPQINVSREQQREVSLLVRV